MRDESLKPDTVSFAMTIIPRNPVAVILASLGLIGMIALTTDGASGCGVTCRMPLDFRVRPDLS